MSNHPEPDRQCIICGKWKHLRAFIKGTYVCRGCSRKAQRKDKKK